MTNIRLRVLPQILPVDGRSIELQNTGTYIQWRYVTDANGEYAWTNLVAIADITGPEGPAIEMQSNGTSIQYRQVGEVTWIDLVPLADLTGNDGAQGIAGTITIGTVDTVGAGDPATVTNSGTVNDAIFDFEIPQGAPGSDGGPIGPQGRLSLTSGVSVTESDVTGATAVYLVPDGVSLFPIYDGTVWQNRPLVEMTLTLNATAHPITSGFDVWVAWQSSAMIIGTGPAWSSVTAGSSSRGTGAGTTEIEIFEGRIVNKNAIVLKNGATTYASVPARQATLVGGFLTVAAGQTSDSKADRLLWNVNGVTRLAQGPDEVTSTWAYSTATYRQANGNTANKFRVFQGLGGRMVTVEACSFVTNSTATKRYIVAGVGINSTTVNAITAAGGGIGATDTGGVFVRGTYRGYPALGLNEFIWLENGGGTDTQTWFGVQAKFAPGIVGEVFL